MSMPMIPISKMPEHLNQLHVNVVFDGVINIAKRPDVTVADIENALVLIEREMRYVKRILDEQMIHCAQCERFIENATPHDDERPHFCTKHGIDLADGSGYCSWAERKSS